MMVKSAYKDRTPYEVLSNCVEVPSECMPLEEEDMPLEEEDPEWSFRYQNNTLFGAVARTKLKSTAKNLSFHCIHITHTHEPDSFSNYYQSLGYQTFVQGTFFHNEISSKTTSFSKTLARIDSRRR